MKKISGIITSVSLVIFIVIYTLCIKTKILAEPYGVLIFTSVIMLALFSFVLEKFFSKPSEILATSISILLLILPIIRQLRNYPAYLPFWLLTAFLTLSVVSLVFSILSLSLLRKEESDRSPSNAWSRRLYYFIELVASSKVQYSMLSIISISMFVMNKPDVYFVYLSFILITLFLSNNEKDIRKLFNTFPHKESRGKNDAIGFLTGVGNKKILKATLFRDYNIELFEGVIINSNVGQDGIIEGLVVRKTDLSGVCQIEILKIKKCSKEYDLKIGEVIKNTEAEREVFVGLACEDSDIQTLYFKYIEGTDISSGSVLTIDISGKQVLYQVINAYIKKIKTDYMKSSVKTTINKKK